MAVWHSSKRDGRSIQGTSRSGLGTGLKLLLPLFIDQIPQTNKIQEVGKHDPPVMGEALQSHCKGEWVRGKGENCGAFEVYCPALESSHLSDLLREKLGV